MRRLVRWAEWALGASALSCALVWGSARAGEWVRPSVERLASQALGHPTHIDSLQFGLVPPRAEAKGIEIGEVNATESATPLWLRIASLRIVPHPGSLLVLWPILAEVDAKGVVAEVTLPSDAHGDESVSVQAPFEPRHLALPIDIRHAAIDIERVHVRRPGDSAKAPLTYVTAQRMRIEATPVGWRERSLKVESPSVIVGVRAPGRPLLASGSVSLEALVHGSLRRPRHLDVQRAYLRGPFVDVTASADARLDGPNAPVTTHVRGQIGGQCPWLDTLWPPHTAWEAWRAARGAVELRTEGDWHAQNAQFHVQLAAPPPFRPLSPSYSGTGGTDGTSGEAGGGTSDTSGPRGTSGISGPTGTSWTSGGTSADEGGLSGLLDMAFSSRGDIEATRGTPPPAIVTIRGRTQPGGLRFDEARLCVPGRCPLLATGEWDQAGKKLQASAEMTRLPVAEMMHALSLPFAGPVTTAVSGHSEAHLSLRRAWKMHAALDWHLGPSAWRRPGSNERVVGVVPAHLKAIVDSQAGITSWSEASLEVGDDALQSEGTYRSRGLDQGLIAQVWTDGFELSAISPIARVAYRGRVAIAGSVETSDKEPFKLRTRMEAERLGIGPVQVGHVEGLVSYERGSLLLRNLVNTRGAGRLQGDIAIHFAEPRTPLEASIAAERIETQELLEDLAVPVPVASRIGATLWGTANVRGPIARPEGTARLESPRLVVDGLDLGRAQIVLKGHEARTRLSGTIATRGERGAASAAAAIDDDGALHLQLSATEVPLKSVLPKLSHRAALTVRLALDGPPEQLDGTLTAFVSRPPKAPHELDDYKEHAALRAAAEKAGEAAGGLSLMVRAQRGVAHFQMHALQGALAAQGTLQLRRALALELKGQLHGVEARELTPWIPQFEAPSRQLGLSIDGSFAASGPLSDWQRLNVRLHIGALGGRLVGAPIALMAPVTLLLRDGLIEVPHLQLQSRALSATLDGQWRLWPAAGQKRDGNKPGEELKLRVSLLGDVAALGPWVPSLTAARGQIKAALQLQGQFTRPLVFGEAELNNGAMRIGIGSQPLEHIALKLVFTGRAMALTVGHANLGRGRVNLQGEWSVGAGTWLDPRGSLSLRTRLEHVPFRPIPDLSSRLTGHIELTGERESLKLQGDVRVESMRYTARLDLDRLLRKRRAPPLKATFLPFARPVALGIKLRAQNDAIVSSKVLEAELAGDLLLTGTSDRVGLLGSITPLWARSRYRDNVFTIPRATVDFTDEYRIAPVYSIEARTRACQIDASVIVQGDSEGYALTAQGRDEHGMVDAQDVLSCLHLGVRLSDFAGTYGHTAGFGDALSGSFDALWTVSGLDDKVRKFLPIRVDELRLTSGWSSINQRTTPRVVVGRELGRRVALRYVRSIDEISDQAFTLETKIDPVTTMQLGYMSARDVPTGDFGVDLRLHWELP